MEKENLWLTYEAEQLEGLEKVCKDYRDFLDAGKTERECVSEIIRQAEARGYRNLYAAERLVPGDKVYVSWMEKSIALFHIGTDNLEDGMNILGAHIDSPRLDLKQNPLYEESGLAYFDTHYYGGIKKYQWVTVPLAIHGVIVRKDGTKEVVSIGEKDTDPVFTITDLLVHLAAKQMEKKASLVIEGEKLDLLIASRPLTEAEGLNKEEKNAVKAKVLKLLKEYYGMEEEDLRKLQTEIEKPCKETEKGFGLANVNERIRMNFGAEYGMKIDSVKGKGTCVEIVIPAVPYAAEKED